MSYKNGKWARQILALQQDDGTWGLEFHSLSAPNKRHPLTTEQALQRLMFLGFDINDAPIRKAVDYMTACLRGERKMDNSWEKLHNWPLFTNMMLAAWIKIFEPDNELALTFARRWADVIEKAFKNGKYVHNDYLNAYIAQFNSKPKGGRELDFATFYQMHLLQGLLAPKTESRMLDYVLTKPNGIYYIHSGLLITPPEVFASRYVGGYLAALTILAGYDLGKEKLGFAVEWLNENRDADGQWDFGAKVNDGRYFPLSDSWRNIEDRKADCTNRVMEFFRKLGHNF